MPTECWDRILDDLHRGGVSRAAFCRRRGLNYQTVTYHLRRRCQVIDSSLQPASAPQFIELTPTTASIASYDILLANGRVVRCGSEFDPDTLRRLIRAIDSC